LTGCAEDKALENPIYATPHFAYHNLGQAYYTKGEYKKAVENYLKAITYQPSFSMAFHHLGITYETMNEWDKATSVIRNRYNMRP